MVPPLHPILTAVGDIDAALKAVSDVDPGFMRTREKRDALIRLTELSSRVEELRLRVLATAGDVAEEAGARDQASWLAHAARVDRPGARRGARLARALEQRWLAVGHGVREGSVNLDQAEVIVRALEDLPADLEPELGARAEAHLVELAAEFGPRSLRVLGRRVLEVVSPEVADEQERQALEREETRAARRTFLTSRVNGDGTTDLRIRIPDAASGRLLTYLEAFTSPRRTPSGSATPSSRSWSPSTRAGCRSTAVRRPRWS